MSDIAILSPAIAPQLFESTTTEVVKPFALIDPVCPDVLMTGAVASHRGLCGFTPDTHGHAHGNFQIRDGHQYFVRKAKVHPGDRTAAQISISHDGAYASATCLALHDQGRGTDSTAPVLDDGTGLPIHEPRWNDYGCFSS